MPEQGPHTGMQEVREGRRELEVEGEESREMQAGLVELQECASLGV